MTTSPYDSLPIGNNDKSSENALEYMEVDLSQLGDASPPVSSNSAPDKTDMAVPELSTKAASSDANTSATADFTSKDAQETSDTDEAKASTNLNPKSESYATRDNAYTSANHAARKLEPNPAPKKTKAAASKPQVKTVPFENAPQYSRLNMKNLNGRCEYILPFEESLLVPDTMPDMQSLLFAEASAALAQPEKLSYTKDDFLAGDITVYTVYVPVISASGSAGGPVDVVKSSIPFKTDKCWDKTCGDNFRVSLSVKNISAEMINERKFTVKGELLICMTEICSCELKIFKSAGDEQLVTASGKVTATDLIHETTDSAEISQDITVKDEMPAPVKILKEDFSVSETHRQITAGKLVINAAIRSQILYLGETDDGDIKTACLSSKTDFAQFIAIEENANVELIRLGFNSSALKMSIENKDKFTLQGNVITHVQVYNNREVSTVTDAYHKSRDIHFDADTKPLHKISSAVSGEISAREVVNLEENAKRPQTLLCGNCCVSEITGRQEKSRLIIEGAMPVKLLALDDSNMPFVISHDVPIRGSLETPSSNTENPEIFIDTAVRDFWFDEINSRQIEINTSLGLTVWSVENESFCTIENLSYADTANPVKLPHMAIYVAGSSDSLWNVAKRYKMDISELASMNGLEADSPLPEGTKLLISK